MASHVEVEAAVAAELVEHVVEERQPGAGLAPRPWGRRGRCATDDARLLGGALRGGRPRSCQDLLQGGEERVVLVGGADRDTQAAVEARPRRAVAHEHRPVEQPCHTSRAVARSRGGTARSWRPTATRRRAGRRGAATSRPRSSTSAATRARISSSKSRASAPGGLLHRVEVVRQHDLVELGDQPRRPDEVAEAGGGHRPRLGVGAGDDERHVVVDQLERRPRRELAVGLVDHEQPGRQVEHRRGRSPRPRPCRSGCWASTGT